MGPGLVEKGVKYSGKSEHRQKPVVSGTDSFLVWLERKFHERNLNFYTQN